MYVHDHITGKHCVYKCVGVHILAHTGQHCVSLLRCHLPFLLFLLLDFALPESVFLWPGAHQIPE